MYSFVDREKWTRVRKRNGRTHRKQVHGKSRQAYLLREIVLNAQNLADFFRLLVHDQRTDFCACELQKFVNMLEKKAGVGGVAMSSF
jgi:hypothetical protein